MRVLTVFTANIFAVAVLDCFAEEQQLFVQYDHRIREVVDYINNNLSHNLSIEALANIASLSPKVCNCRLG